MSYSEDEAYCLNIAQFYFEYIKNGEESSWRWLFLWAGMP
jgi:hypothetical protein